jgi:hypothetical protein
MDDLDDLEALDAEQRELRREQLKHWTRLQEKDAARARAVVADPTATSEQKREARILLGAYAISPGLMAAGGHDFSSVGHTIEHSNHHPRVPPVPREQSRAREALRSWLLREARRPEPAAWPKARPHEAVVSKAQNHAAEIAPAHATPALVPGEETAPDLVEEILGWKVLRFGADALPDGGGVVVAHPLSSPRIYIEWENAGWTRAKCARHLEHEPPVETCTCGIYAVADARPALAYVWAAPLTVLARVGLAGKVIPGSRGWRAERGRVVALTRTGHGTRDYPQMLARIADHYRVPILDLDFLAPRPDDQEP